MKFIKAIILILASKSVFAEELSTARYTAGALAATFSPVGILANVQMAKTLSQYGHSIPVSSMLLMTVAMPSFGIGQAIQGRFSETGYKYAAGEAIGLGVFFYGVIQSMDCLFSCSEETRKSTERTMSAALLVGGAIYIPSRIIEVIDAWSAPHGTASKSAQTKAKFHVAPDVLNRTVVAGLSKSF